MNTSCDEIKLQTIKKYIKGLENNGILGLYEASLGHCSFSFPCTIESASFRRAVK